MISFKKGRIEKTCVLKSVLKILQSNFAFPNDGKMYDRKLFLKFSLPGILFGPLILFGTIGHIYITLKRSLWPEPIESMIFLVQISISTIMLLLLLTNSKNFLIQIERINTFSYGIPPQCTVLSKNLDFAAPKIFYGIKVICLFYAYLRVIDNTFCTNTGLIGDDGYVCNLPFPLWYPMRMNTYGSVIFLWISFIIVSSFYFPILCILVAVPFASIHLVIYRIRELKRLMLKNTTESGSTTPIKREELIFFIKYHAEILDCVQMMNNGLGYNYLPYRTLLPILIALHLFKFINQKDVAALFALLPWFLTVILFCSMGELLEFERSSLHTTFNDIPWYNMDVKLRKMYHLFLGNLAIPLRMRVRPNAEMSNIFLAEILKGTYSFMVYLGSKK